MKSPTDDEAFDDVRERTEDSAHAPVEDVCDLVLKRAQDPHDNHMDAQFDEAMTEIGDRYGDGVVQTVIHRILVEHYPFRTATVELDMHHVDGIPVRSWLNPEPSRPDTDDPSIQRPG